jgi:hypothetical protein
MGIKNNLRCWEERGRKDTEGDVIAVLKSLVG